jgi:hypothetical protein
MKLNVVFPGKTQEAPPTSPTESDAPRSLHELTNEELFVIGQERRLQVEALRDKTKRMLTEWREAADELNLVSAELMEIARELEARHAPTAPVLLKP